MRKKVKLSQFNLDYLDELEKIAKENPNMTFGDALEILAKKHPNSQKDLGTMHSNGKFTKTDITSEGVETKEVSINEIFKNVIDEVDNS